MVTPLSANRIVFLVAFSVALCVGSAARTSASVILPNLPPGSQYQLIFATSQETTSGSSLISTYNSFVTTSAVPLTALLPAGVTWKAIVSTGTSPNDAKDNAPSFSNIPIYNTQGIKVSAGSLYSASSLLSSVLYDENGTLVATSSGTNLIWTGSDASGNSLNPLGVASPEFGNANSSTTSWITGSSLGNTIPWPVYALSSPIPEPSTLGLMAVAILGVGRRTRTKR